MAHFGTPDQKEVNRLTLVTVYANERLPCTRIAADEVLQASNGKKKREFDPTAFLATIGNGRENMAVAKKQTIFAQETGTGAVFYIHIGRPGSARAAMTDCEQFTNL